MLLQLLFIPLSLLSPGVISSHIVLFATHITDPYSDAEISRAHNAFAIHIDCDGAMRDIALAISKHNCSGAKGVDFKDLMLFDQRDARYPIPHPWPFIIAHDEHVHGGMESHPLKLRNASDIYYSNRSVWQHRVTLFQLRRRAPERERGI